MNGQAIGRWMKSNLVIVVCIVVIIGAPVGLWFVSSGWSAELQSNVKKRGGKLDQLASAGKAQFSWPGSNESSSVIVTPTLVDAFKSHAELLKSQADDVVVQANARNQAGFENHFTVLLPFPKPKSVPGWDTMKIQEREDAWKGVSEADRQEALYQALQVHPQGIHEQLLKLYEHLLHETLNAGSPPDPADIKVRLDSVRDALTDGGATLQSLDEQERTDLERKLGDERMAMYRERAEGIGVYLTLQTLAPPSFVSTDVPDQEEITNWLWRYWVLQRVAQGIQAANDTGSGAGMTSEVVAAIKRIDRIDIRGLMSLETPAAADRAFAKGGGGGDGRGGGNNPPGGGPPGGGPPGGGPPGIPPGGPPSGPPGGGPGGGGPGGGFGGAPTGPTAPEPGKTDRTKSITGRVSNQLYDVVLVDLDMIVATDRIDQVLRGFSRPVETAVLDVVIQPADAFAALQQGFYYGTGSVSRLVLTIETIWLREWTQVHLPDSVRNEMGFPARQMQAQDSGMPGQGPPGMPRPPGGPPRGGPGHPGR
ncbi:MAG: hypothetical protein MK101_09315 [Phycisphaerales bacterium]|nr:hypothetical protein [Phycisphaerales bacterium]